MGHLINPIRYRLGNSVFWANNWPALEKTRYFLSYEIHQEINQYFRNLLYNFRKLKLKKQRKGGRIILRKIRHPKLYFSHANVNLFGLNLDNMMIDVTIYDFFLDHYLTEALSPESIKKPDAPHIAGFLKKFSRYVGLEFFFRHKRILQKMSKEQFIAVIKTCRKKVSLLEQISINKLQIFIEIYTEFIKRSLFSVFNDKIHIYNPGETLFQREKRLLNRLSFTRRIKLIDKYWTRKYSHTENNNKSLLTFQNYFTSEFYNLVTQRKKQNLSIEKEQRTSLATQSYLDYTSNYQQQIKDRALALVSFSKRITNKLEKALQINRSVLEKPAPFYKSNIHSEFRTFPHEKPSIRHQDLYLKSNVYTKKIQITPENSIPFFIQEFCNNETLIILKSYIRPLLNNKNIKSNIIYIIERIYDLNDPEINTKEKIFYLTNTYFINKLFQLFIFIESNLPNIKETNDLLLKGLQYIDDVRIYNRLQYKAIKYSLKKNSNIWLKYDLDPFYQIYMQLRNIKTLHLNINIGIGPETDKDHDVIDAKFIALYIKRLFKRNKFKVPDIQRTMYRSLSRLPYLEGFVIIFAGRFTRRDSKVRRISKGGIFHFGAISKLIDYHTIGFASKFGYCGIKIFLQYKNKWPTIEQQQAKPKDIIPISYINQETEFNTKLAVLPETIRLFPSSKRYTRHIQQLFSNNKIPYYNNGKN